MGNKVDDKTFSFLGDFSETIIRSIFLAAIGFVVILLVIFALIAKAQNATEEDPTKRKMNNRKMWTVVGILLGILVFWPLVELIKANVKKPSNGGKSSSVMLVEQVRDLFYLKQPSLLNVLQVKGLF